MSRIGKQLINLPEGTSAQIAEKDRIITIKGAKGELAFNFGYEIDIKKQAERVLKVEKIGKTRLAKALWGTVRSIVANMAEGVSQGFQKQLELNGVGYKMNLAGKKLLLNLGFSHPIEKEIPAGLEVSIDKNILTVKGIDKQQVGQWTAEVRALKKVEPYKGKGFRYVGEEVIKKEGKKAGAGE